MYNDNHISLWWAVTHFYDGTNIFHEYSLFYLTLNKQIQNYKIIQFSCCFWKCGVFLLSLIFLPLGSEKHISVQIGASILFDVSKTTDESNITDNALVFYCYHNILQLNYPTTFQASILFFWSIFWLILYLR